MRVRNPPLKPASASGGGPGEYFMRKLNSRGIVRNPAPRKLFGDPSWFDHLARRSRSPHTHLHSVLGYKDEPACPSREVKDSVVGLYLCLLRGGLAADKVYCLGVDHGDHDHLAVYRHLVAPKWPRFQPFFHENDWLLGSDFQWLVNRRYGFNAPENPANAQLISIAGKHFGEEEIKFVAGLREEIKELRTSGALAKPRAFFDHLEKERGCSIKVIDAPDEGVTLGGEDADDAEDGRFWIEVTTPSGLVVPLKGPLRTPSFKLEDYEKSLQKKQEKYQNFINDPSAIWQRFLAGSRKRRAYNRGKYPQFCDPNEPGPFLGFDDLEPSRHLTVATSGTSEVS
jgi:hypothetical protein